jgi:ATP-dependent Clp protease ATP-binding subunit ClpC
MLLAGELDAGDRALVDASDGTIEIRARQAAEH